jgi:hypothetical protein
MIRHVLYGHCIEALWYLVIYLLDENKLSGMRELLSGVRKIDSVGMGKLSSLYGD